jgi:propanol-preferring alcohol dehydrogenase
MDAQIEIPKFCKAGVVINEGPDFEIKIEMVPVPEPGENEEFSRRLYNI